MTGDTLGLFWIFIIFIIMLSVAAFYCILATRNMIRVLIGLEILTKAVTLFFVIIGHITKQIALAQAFVITMIVIEVVVIVVAGGVILSVYRHDESLDVRNLRNLKG
jgi:NADH-quinone oxidoreductase subunit K